MEVNTYFEPPSKIQNGSLEEKGKFETQAPSWLALSQYDEATADAINKKRVEYYSQNASIYDKDIEDILQYNGARKCAETLHKHLKGRADAKILDVACGTGLVISELHKLFPYDHVHGLEPASGMIEQAQRLNLYQKLMLEYFFVGSSDKHNGYDAVVVCGAFVPEHLRAEHIVEMYRCIKIGGVIVNVMRAEFLDKHDDLKLLKLHVQQLEKEGRVEVVEDYTFEKYIAEYDGHVYVIRRLN